MYFWILFLLLESVFISQISWKLRGSVCRVVHLVLYTPYGNVIQLRVMMEIQQTTRGSPCSAFQKRALKHRWEVNTVFVVFERTRPREISRHFRTRANHDEEEEKVALCSPFYLKERKE